MGDIVIEALTMNDNVVAVNVIVAGIPLHYVPKTTNIDGSTPVGPCEVWLHWGHEHGRVTRRPLDESLQAVTL